MSALELPQLTKGEQRIRKIWSFINLMPLGFVLLIRPTLLGMSLFLGYITFNQMMASFIGMLIPIVSAMLGCAIQYHCIYKKYGTRLLTFFIFTFLLGVACNLSFLLVGAFHYILNEELANFPSLAIPFSILVIAYEVIAVYIMLKLRYINKKSQFQKLSYDGYTQALDELKQAPNLEELKFTHQRLREKWSSFKIVLKRAFKEHQKELQKGA